MVDVKRGKSADTPELSDPRTIEFTRIEPWHSVSVDYFELHRIVQILFTSLVGRLSDTLWIVSHKSLPQSALMKIKEVPPFDSLKNETEVYRAVEGKGIAPQFFGHLTENGRIVGTLTEHFNDIRHPHEGDLEACQKALSKLHEIGYLHGDVHSGNFLMHVDGSATLIDFERSKKNTEKAAFDREMTILKHELTDHANKRKSN